jgi:Ca-activated chloride channel homolog
MSFGSPYLLLSLLVIPPAVAGYALLERRRARHTTAWAGSVMLPNVVQAPSRRLRHVPAALFLLGLTALLVGFARPQRAVTNSNANAPTVVVVLDVSGSMASHDVGPSRIGAASEVAKRFITDVPAHDRVSVVTFGNRIRVLVPPTLDRAAAIAQLPSKITPEAGTSLGDALSSAIAVVTATSGKTQPGSGYPGAILVFSDGAQTAGGTLPDQAANTAFVEHVPIDTVAVGTPGGTVTQPVHVDGFDTSAEFAVPVDAGSLQAIAKATSGTAFALRASSEGPSLAGKLKAVTHGLRSPAQPERRSQGLSAFSAAVALALVAGGIAVSTLWFGRAA